MALLRSNDLSRVVTDTLSHISTRKGDQIGSKLRSAMFGQVETSKITKMINSELAGITREEGFTAATMRRVSLQRLEERVSETLLPSTR